MHCQGCVCGLTIVECPMRGCMPALSGVHKERDKSRVAASPLPSQGPTSGWKCQPLHSRGPPNQRTKSEAVVSTLPSQRPTSGQKCCVTLAFSRVHKQRDKIRSGCLTPAFSGAHRWAEVLRNPCILGDPQTRGQNHKGRSQPCLLGGQSRKTRIKKSVTRFLFTFTKPNWLIFISFWQ